MIDFDHNATTQPLPEVVQTVSRVMQEAYANPGSRHAAGRRARQVLEESRETVADVLGAKPEEVVFTAGGTEATNLALLGFADGRRGTVLLPPGEHPATEETVRYLESWKWQRHTLPVDHDGRLQSDALTDVPWNDVKLASLLLAHNETGVIQDVSELSENCQRQGIPLHLDAVQAVGKIDVTFADLGVSTMSVGAHKFHGPRGVGALLVREEVRLPPAQFGGHQESGQRPGTECVALAAGMAVALEQWQLNCEQRTAAIREMRDRLQSLLAEACAPTVVNGSLEFRLPNTLNMAFPGCSAEALLVALDLDGIACSLGSTCSSGASEPAAILVAMDRPDDVLSSSLRFSLGYDNRRDEVEEAADRIAAIVHRLRAT